MFQVRRGEESNQAALGKAESGADRVSEASAMATGSQGVLHMDAPTASDDPWSISVQEVCISNLGNFQQHLCLMDSLSSSDCVGS